MRTRLAFLIFFGVLLTARGDPPEWWYIGEVPAVDRVAAENNHGPANIGQAKWMAQRAIDVLGSMEGSFAAAIRDDLTLPQPRPNDPTSFLPAILDFKIPDPLPPDWSDRQHAPLTIGQLKAIATPFYDRFYLTYPGWVDRESDHPWEQGQLQLNGTKDPNDSFNFYPWSADPSDDSNLAIATIGQLKAAFSLRFEYFLYAFDSDIDGLSNWFEITLHHTNPFCADSDEDGIKDGLEAVMGTNPNAVGPDADSNGFPDDWEMIFANQCAIYPPIVRQSLSRNQSATSSTFIRNDTDTPINYAVTLTGHTFPGYSYKTSTTGDVTYTWEDIRTSGTLLETISNADDAFEKIQIKRFTFPFYAQNFSQVFVSSNGLITFGSGSSQYSNLALPNTNAPEFLIAALWDDLAPHTSGDIYYKEETDRLIIQYQNVAVHGKRANHTFQVVLFSNGHIQLRYQTQTEPNLSCTVGIQNSTQNAAIQIVYNTAYLLNQFAIEIQPISEFFKITPSTGRVAARSVATLTGLFQTNAAPAAIYQAVASISHEGDPPEPLTFQVELHVLDKPCIVKLTQPTDGASIAYGTYTQLIAAASDLDGIHKVGFYQDGILLGEIRYPPYAYFFRDIDLGPHTCMARVTDVFGTTTDSAPVTYTVLVDTDRDGLPDSWELANGLNTLTPDADNDPDRDGFSNLEEYQNSTNPQVADLTTDVDGDGMWDRWELKHALDPTRDDGGLDSDEDSFSNLREFQLGTDPNNFDTDGDRLPDGWEVNYQLDPLSTAGIDGDAGDPDEDGVTNFIEWQYGSNPRVPDTDGDSIKDGDEITQSSNPNDSRDGGIAPPINEIIPVPFCVGDPSGSESETWRMQITGYGPDDFRTLNVRSPAGGQMGEMIVQLRQNNRYEIVLFHLQTNSSQTQGGSQPDYDWQAQVDGQPNTPVLEAATDETVENGYFIIKNHWLVQNVDGLLGTVDQSFDSTNFTSGKKAVLLPIRIAVDANRDGQISFTPQDKTTEDSPFRFWINDDQDDVDYNEPILVTSPDLYDSTIRTKRDLEDFCRLSVNIDLDNQILKNGEVKIGLKFKYQSDSYPTIQIFENQSHDGNLDYLTDDSAAFAQTLQQSMGVTTGATLVISTAYWLLHEGSTAHLIFEGTVVGKAELVVVVLNRSGSEIGESMGTWMHLLNVKEMYQRARIVNEAEEIPDPWDDASPASQTWNWDPFGYPYVEDPAAAAITAIFVHGWRLKYYDCLNWADTTYKRLWHQGFKGKFYAFRWPTFSGDNNGLPYGYDEWIETAEFPNDTHFPPGGATYNRSEYRAWLSGPALAHFVNQLPNLKNRNLIAHSMGNVIAGSALRSGMEVTNYAMCNAAMSAMAYDPAALHPDCAAYETPDTDPDPAIRDGYGLTNKFNLPIPTVIFNFGLPNDQSLGSWSANNAYFKPEHLRNYYYDDYPMPMTTFRLFHNPFKNNFREVNGLPEAMAFVTQSRSRAAGAEMGTGGCIAEKNRVDMSRWFDKTHSAQWCWNYLSTRLFWEELTAQLSLNQATP